MTVYNTSKGIFTLHRHSDVGTGQIPPPLISDKSEYPHHARADSLLVSFKL